MVGLKTTLTVLSLVSFPHPSSVDMLHILSCNNSRQHKFFQLHTGLVLELLAE